MRATAILGAVILLSVCILVGCTSKADIAHKADTTVSSISRSSIETDLTDTSKKTQDIKKQEEDFVNRILQAINQNDTSVLINNYDSVYGEPSSNEAKELSGGLELYHGYLKGEKLDRFEFAKNIPVDGPNASKVTINQYFFICKAGIKRDILIKCYLNEEKATFKFYDPLLFYGPETVKRAQDYFNAIQTKNIEYLYNYIRIANEDPDSTSYSDSKHNKEYENVAVKTIKNYEKAFRLDSMKCEFTGNISSVSDSSALKIEFKISGLSPGGEHCEHLINGVFEFPMWSVYDTWYGYH